VRRTDVDGPKVQSVIFDVVKKSLVRVRWVDQSPDQTEDDVGNTLRARGMVPLDSLQREKKRHENVARRVERETGMKHREWRIEEITRDSTMRVFVPTDMKQKQMRKVCRAHKIVSPIVQSDILYVLGQKCTNSD
jgi:hypothetical protein